MFWDDFKIAIGSMGFHPHRVGKKQLLLESPKKTPPETWLEDFFYFPFGIFRDFRC